MLKISHRNSESGDADSSADIGNSGDNVNFSAPVMQVANTGNFQNGQAVSDKKPDEEGNLGSASSCQRVKEGEEISPPPPPQGSVTPPPQGSVTPPPPSQGDDKDDD